MRFCKYVVLLFFSTVFCASALEAERLFYLSNGEVLQGCVYKPKGKGPFPVVVFNQNSTRPWPSNGPLDPFPALATFFTKHGYVLFAPGRRNIKEFEEEDQPVNTKKKSSQADDVERERKTIRFHQHTGETIFAAIETVKAQSCVDANRIFVLGQQSGGTTTLLLSEKDLAVKCYVVFSPASGTWPRSPILQSELKRAVKNAKAPIFLIQPENDLNLSPAEILGKELKKKGAPNAVKIYPPYGKTPRESVQLGMHAPEIWGADVLSFFEECVRSEK